MASKDSSAKSMLAEALRKAINAVDFDCRHNFGDAIRAYGESCALLGQVVRVLVQDEDRTKLEAIRTAYVRRIYELQGYAAPSMHKL